MRRAVVVAVVVLAAACQDITVDVRYLCRGDTLDALADTNLIRCETLDSMAVRP